MSDPLIDPSDLGTYLADTSLNTGRAMLMIQLAQAACERVVSPFPPAAIEVLYRVAARGYTTTTSSRQYQLDQADSSYGNIPGPVGSIYLTDRDKADLMETVDVSPESTAFTIRTRPAVCGPVPDAYGLLRERSDFGPILPAYY